MIHMKQPEGSSLCGQTVIAMVGGVSLDRAIELVGHSRGTHTKDLKKAFASLGISCSERLKLCKRNMPVLPKRCVVACRNGNRAHWMLFWDGDMYDPSYVWPDMKGWKITSYLEIYS